MSRSTPRVSTKTEVWGVDLMLNKLRPGQLPSEVLLEEMIINSPSILSDEWMLIGRQESTDGVQADYAEVALDH